MFIQINNFTLDRKKAYPVFPKYSDDSFKKGRQQVPAMTKKPITPYNLTEKTRASG